MERPPAGDHQEFLWNSFFNGITDSVDVDGFPDALDPPIPPTAAAVLALMGQPDLLADSLTPDDVCPICLVNFQQSGRPFIRWNGTHTGIDGGRVSCGHPYHRDCIRDYVVTNHRCPVCRSEIPHVVSHNATMVARDTPLAAPVTTWATLPPAALLGRMMDMRVQDITGWIASANLWNEGGDGGSSRLFTVLVNHALRRAGVPLPTRREGAAYDVHLAPLHGGPLAEEAWRLECDAAERVDGWTATCAATCLAVTHYIDTHGLPMLNQQLVGRWAANAWPANPEICGAILTKTKVAGDMVFHFFSLII